jgi:hypothetical protein
MPRREVPHAYDGCFSKRIRFEDLRGGCFPEPEDLRDHPGTRGEDGVHFPMGLEGDDWLCPEPIVGEGRLGEDKIAGCECGRSGAFVRAAEDLHGEEEGSVSVVDNSMGCWTYDFRELGFEGFEACVDESIGVVLSGWLFFGQNRGPLRKEPLYKRWRERRSSGQLFRPGFEHYLGALVLLIPEHAIGFGGIVDRKLMTDDERRVDVSFLNAFE